MHALDGVILGFFIGRARFLPDARSRFLTNMLGLVIAIAFHGVYDMFAFITTISERLIGWCIVGLVWTMVVQWGTAHRMVQTAQRRSRLQHTEEPEPVAVPALSVQTASAIRFCRYCGKPVGEGSNFCTNCGSGLK
jgi:hypothetical protein